MTPEKVIIIIPTFNEAFVIEETLIKVFQATSDIHDQAVHVLIFDSASTDETQEIVKRLQNSYDKLHLISESQKTGLGSAYLQAMRYALEALSADIIIEFDADLSHQPHYLPPMLQAIKNHDVILGSRYVPGGGIPHNWGWHRKYLSKFGNRVARLCLTSKYQDLTSGFRLTRRQALLQALPDQFISNQYAYKLELLWSLYQNKTRILEYPILFVDREKGHSKLPTNSILDSLRVIFLLRYRRMFLRKP